MGYTDFILYSISIITLFGYILYAMVCVADLFEYENKRLYIILSVINTIFFFGCKYFGAPLYIIYFLGVFIITIQLYFFVKKNIRKALLGSSIFILPLSSVQMLVMSVMSLLLNRQPYDMFNNYDLFSINIIVTFLLSIIVLRFLKYNINDEKMKSVVHNKQQATCTLLTSMFIICCSCFNIYVYTVEGNYKYMAMTMIATQVFLISFFSLLISYLFKIRQIVPSKNSNDIIKEKLQKAIKDDATLKKGGYKDSLTGCYTKNYSTNYLDALIANNTIGYCIVYIDLDRLKLVNETYGHDEGDHYLKKVSSVITKVFKKEDMLARIGDDEFLLIVNDCSEMAVHKKMNKVQEKLHITSKYRLSYTMEISFGILYVDDNKINATQIKLLNEADHKMYLNKQEKRKKQFVEVKK